MRHESVTNCVDALYAWFDRYDTPTVTIEPREQPTGRTAAHKRSAVRAELASAGRGGEVEASEERSNKLLAEEHEAHIAWILRGDGDDRIKVDPRAVRLQSMRRTGAVDAFEATAALWLVVAVCPRAVAN